MPPLEALQSEPDPPQSQEGVVVAGIEVAGLDGDELVLDRVRRPPHAAAEVEDVVQEELLLRAVGSLRDHAVGGDLTPVAEEDPPGPGHIVKFY